MNVSDIMTDKTVAVNKDEPVVAAARLLKRYNIGALPVIDGENHLRGMITDRDIVLRCIAAEADPRSTKISEIMSRGIITASSDEPVSSAVRYMSEDQVRRLPVVDNGKLVGMLTLGDLARREDCEMEAAQALSEISTNIRRR